MSVGRSSGQNQSENSGVPARPLISLRALVLIALASGAAVAAVFHPRLALGLTVGAAVLTLLHALVEHPTQ
ncbi:hypothetical protein HUT06_21285 [Actinomadura sp. NAK00032]|uniref:hypothetical protein n=1 Tax=Actinomadura sp. NAK00032 TaxID=2742128 RepID=UPI001590328C|nr:hypothetical protein [Actinomadura sp. NAK00032]QKW36254.1 hypothetical protein HUT06_21285 [Actinomadura sp. NAK00032]